MSNGIGKLQLEIMERCQSFWAKFRSDDDKLPGEMYEEWHGGEYRRRPAREISDQKLRSVAETYGITLDPEPAMQQCMVISHGIRFQLEPPVIDLRLVKKRMQNKIRTDVDRYCMKYSTSFSRAGHGLVKRRLLRRCSYGEYREIRFVEMVPPTRNS